MKEVGSCFSILNDSLYVLKVFSVADFGLKLMA